MADKGQEKDIVQRASGRAPADSNAFVFEKAVFSNVFEKDIQRVYLYKKAERIAKAIGLVAPAFIGSPALKDRLDRAAIGLVDASVAPGHAAHGALARELLALSSVLAMSRSMGVLSPMNADLIANEAQALLHEVAVYEEPRIAMGDAPTLAGLAKAFGPEAREPARLRSVARVTFDPDLSDNAEAKGQNAIGQRTAALGQGAPRASGTPSERRTAILEVLRAKGPSYIKDISLVVRDVSEKTIQRELALLVSEGAVVRKGDRRWTTYEIPA